MDTRQPDPNELTEVFSAADPTQVQIARDMLAGAGIECFVFDGDASRMLGSTAAIAARLMVYGSDAEEALSRLKELGFID